MTIYLYKQGAYIRGFQSHIKKPHLWDKKNLRTISNEEYLPLLYFLTGREHVKETNKFPTATFGNISLRDDGDWEKEHTKITKRVRELNNLT